MNIVVNQLFESSWQRKAYLCLTDWNERIIRGQGGWDAYLEQETGVHGDQWLTYSAYLVIDEAKESYWDGALGQISSSVLNLIPAHTSSSSHHTAHQVGALGIQRGET